MSLILLSKVNEMESSLHCSNGLAKNFMDYGYIKITAINGVINKTNYVKLLRKIDSPKCF